MKRIFIDGKAGTTGLKIYERLSLRKDIELLTLSDDKRKNEDARKEMLNSADIVFLCLPDDAAARAAELLENPDTVIIDTSTAHRTSPGWTYGFAELSSEQEELIKNSKRIANPGCHASGFIALCRPLIDAGIIAPDSELTCHSITGYSGGGKKMIEEYQSSSKTELYDAPRQYGLAQSHKHLNEMTKISGLKSPPIFCPIVSDFYSGMEVTVPLFSSQLVNEAGIQDIVRIYSEKYNGGVVSVCDLKDEAGMLSAASLSGKDSMKIAVYGNEQRILLCAVYDNLGKGASGAAIENMNIVMGVDKTTGLDL